MRWPYTGGFGMQLGDARTYSYWDAGTGTVDFSEPHATVEMGHPPEPTRYTWQSAPHRRPGIPLRHPHRYRALALRP